MAFDLEAARAELVAAVTAIKSQDAREDELKTQLRVNHTERGRNFHRIAAIYSEAEHAGLTPEQWRTLNADIRQDVSRALTVSALEGALR